MHTHKSLLYILPKTRLQVTITPNASYNGIICPLNPSVTTFVVMVTNTVTVDLIKKSYFFDDLRGILHNIRLNLHSTKDPEVRKPFYRKPISYVTRKENCHSLRLVNNPSKISAGKIFFNTIFDTCSLRFVK